MKNFLHLALVFVTVLAFTIRAHAQTSLKSILKKGEIRIGMTGVQPPYSLEDVNGDLMGFEVDLAQILAEAMGVDCKFVKMPFNQLLPALEDGKIDAVMSGMTITVARNVENVFIGPYTVTGKTLLTNQTVLDRINQNSLRNVGKLKLLALKGTTSEDFIKTYVPDATFGYVNEYSEAVKMVLEGKADALVSDYPVCALNEMRYEGQGVVCLDEPVTLEPIGMALNTDDARLINVIENYFNTLQLTGNLELITYKWFEDSSWLLRAKIK